MLHDYTSKEVSSCLKSRKLVFAGDSTIRQIFWAVAKKLDVKGAEWELATAEKHADLKFERFNIQLEFIWDPFLNSSRLEKVLELHHETEASYAVQPEQKQGPGAAIILVGGGLWHAHRLEAAPLEDFSRAINQTLSYMRPNFIRQPEGGLLKSIDEASPRKDLLLIEPVETPLFDKLTPARTETITPEKIRVLNQFLFHQQVSAGKQAGPEILWSHARMTYDQPTAFDESALHVAENVAARRADVLLNLRCNAVVAARGGYPFDRTCCSAYSRLEWVQWSLIVGGNLVFALATFASIGIFNLLTLHLRYHAIID